MSPSKPNAKRGSNWRAMPVKIARCATPASEAALELLVARAAHEAAHQLLRLSLERPAHLGAQLRRALAQATGTRGAGRARSSSAGSSIA